MTKINDNRSCKPSEMDKASVKATLTAKALEAWTRDRVASRTAARSAQSRRIARVLSYRF